MAPRGKYVALLANQAGKDIWINIPASATDDYVRQLATLLHARLNPALKFISNTATKCGIRCLGRMRTTWRRPRRRSRRADRRSTEMVRTT